MVDSVERRHADGSLAPVRAAIPEALRRRSSTVGRKAIARDGTVYALIVVGLVLAEAWWQVVLLELAAGLAVSALFVLGHDAAHDALVDDDEANRRLARWLMVPSWHVAAAWVLGHNRVHHGFTARQGMDFVWHPVTVEEYRAMPWHRRLRHRVEWSPVGAGAYYLRAVWWEKMIRFDPPTRHAAQITADKRWLAWRLVAVSAVFVGLGIAGVGAAEGGLLAGVWLWAKVLLLPFLLFSQVIGWTVYVHHIGPDIPWWTTEQWTRRRAQTDSTVVLRFPRLVDSVLHNIFWHVPHHVDTRVPWQHLPAATRAIEDELPGTVIEQRFGLRSHLRGVRACKLYDFEARTWHGYRTGASAR